MPPINGQPTALNVPFAQVAGFAFNLNSLIGVDLADYEPGAEDRVIELLLLGPHAYQFEGKAADEFYTWYLNLTGQAKIQTAAPPPPVNPFAKQL